MSAYTFRKMQRLANQEQVARVTYADDFSVLYADICREISGVPNGSGGMQWHIYFVRFHTPTDCLVKIGLSRKVNKRLYQIIQSCPPFSGLSRRVIGVIRFGGMTATERADPARLESAVRDLLTKYRPALAEASIYYMGFNVNYGQWEFAVCHPSLPRKGMGQCAERKPLDPAMEAESVKRNCTI